ncbi:unnamed protein product [Ascophyllum nodosum]
MEKITQDQPTQRRSSWIYDSLMISYASRRGTSRCRRCKGYMAHRELHFGIFFKSSIRKLHLYQGFHLSCCPPPAFLTCPGELEGIEDISLEDTEIISAWITTGVAPPALCSLSGAKERFSAHTSGQTQGLVHSSLTLTHD